MEYLVSFCILLRQAQRMLQNGVALATALQQPPLESVTRKRVDLESFAQEEVSLT